MAFRIKQRLEKPTSSKVPEEKTALKSAVTDYSALFGNAPAGIFQSTPQGRFLQVNPAMARIYGYASPEEMTASITDIGRQIYVDSDERQEFQQILLERGEIFEYIGQNYRKDKTIIWTQTTARAVKDAQGNILLYEGFITDITDRKRAEFQNRILTEVQGILLTPCPINDVYQLVSQKTRELIGEGITLTSVPDEKNKTVHMGPYHGLDIPLEKVLAILGIDPRKKSFSLEDMNEEELRIYRSGKLEVLEGGLYVLMTRLVPKHACQVIERLLHVEKIYAIGFVHKDEHIGGLIILARNDITPHIATIEQIVSLATIVIERKLAEREVENREKRFRALIEYGRDNISMLAKDGTLLWESPSIDSTLGYAPDQFMGKNIFQLMHPDDQAWAKDMYLQITQSPGKIQEATFRLLHSNGTWRWIESSARNLLDEPGVQAVVINYRDITERKRAELQSRLIAEVQEFLLGPCELIEIHQLISQKTRELIGDGITITSSMDEKYKSVRIESYHGMDISFEKVISILGVDPRQKVLSLDDFSEGDVRAYRSGKLEKLKDGVYALTGRTVPRQACAILEKLLRVQDVYVMGFIHNSEHLGGLAILARNDISPHAEAIEQIVNLAAIAMERKQVEQALQESEAQFRAVVQTATEAIIMMNNRGEIISWNTAAENIFGYHTNEMMETSIGRIAPNQFHATYRYGIENALAKDEWKIVGRTVEVAGRAKDGREFPIEMSLAEWKTEKGNFFTAVIRDISERKEAEKRIWHSERKYHELFRVSKDGITIFLQNPHGPPSTFVELNDAAASMLGYTREEMLKLTPQKLLHPQLNPKQIPFRSPDFEMKGTANFEAALMHKDGHTVFAEFTGQLIQYEGKPAIMNIVRDITERKNHENELRAIATLSAALRTAATRAEMLPVIVSQLVLLLNCETASIEIIDPLTGEAVTEAAHGLWKALIGTRQKSGTGANAIISQTRKPYHTNELKNDENFLYRELIGRGIHGGIGMPLIAQSNLIGFIWTGHKNNVSETEVRLLAAISDIAANAIYRSTLHEQTQKDAADLAQAYDSTLEGWARALELRDQETEGHTRRVVKMTVDLARTMGVEERELENIRRGALLHDIGKMGIPDSILLKQGPLDASEWEIMRQHPEYAYKLLNPIDYLHPVLAIPHFHHEKWDGTGYPQGLMGENIPLAARIFAIVDVWDALTSDRPYRPAWSKEKALAHITEQVGKHFDPAVVHAFLKIV